MTDDHIVRSPKGALFYAQQLRSPITIHFADGRRQVSWLLVGGRDLLWKYYVRDDGVVWLVDLPHPPMKPQWRRIYDFKVYKRRVRRCKSCSEASVTGKIVHDRGCPRG